jgi:hypothetical protein
LDLTEVGVVGDEKEWRGEQTTLIPGGPWKRAETAMPAVKMDRSSVNRRKEMAAEEVVAFGAKNGEQATLQEEGQDHSCISDK